ncbi:MAG: hypothetical protein IJF83_05870 [Methanobrevibacter sp.]|nr:hypothetical protein [Methanobrevibacter sp.]
MSNELIQELYEFRMLYNAIAFNELHKHKEIEVYKSKRHNNGELCFDGEWFIVVAILPTGQITNHYHIDNWDLFKIPSKAKMEHKFDEHTPQDVIQRIKDYLILSTNS